jgi:hypothetical protein
MLMIFETRKEEVTRGWRKLYNEELHNLYFSSYIMSIFKSRRFNWMEYVAHMRDEKYLQNFNWRT